MPSIAQMRSILGRILLLMKAAKRLGVPMVATEHWPENIGPVASAVKTQLGGLSEVFVKRHFAATAESGFAQLPDDAHSTAYEGNTQGWLSELNELVAYLDAA